MPFVTDLADDNAIVVASVNAFAAVNGSVTYRVNVRAVHPDADRACADAIVNANGFH